MRTAGEGFPESVEFKASGRSAPVSRPTPAQERNLSSLRPPRGGNPIMVRLVPPGRWLAPCTGLGNLAIMVRCPPGRSRCGLLERLFYM